MEVKQQEMVTVAENKGGRFRWMAVTALLLAIGAILHLVSPGVGGITPNWTIAMYCLAINLVRPTFKQAFGIGVVSAAINIPSSKSALPYANLVSEPVGALVCALIVSLAVDMTFGKVNLRPAVSAFISTVASGLTFVTVLKLILGLSMQVYLYGMLPVVLMTAVMNTVITQVLYFPAKKLLEARGDQSCQM